MNTSSGKDARSAEGTFGPAYPALFNKALERVAEVNKTSLDLAMEHNVEVLDSYRNVLNASSVPGLFLFDLAGQVIESYATLQKSLLELVVNQSTCVIEAVQGRNRDGRAVQTDDPGDQEMGLSPEVESTMPDPATEDTNQLRADTLLAKNIVDLFVMQQPANTSEDIGGLMTPSKITDTN